MSDIESGDIHSIRDVYVGQCPSVSGRSTLTYVVGKDAKGALYLRISGNTGQGMWCKDWATAQAVERVVNSSGALTAKRFQVLHPGKSINTGGFVLAALLDLGLVRPCESNTRIHEPVPTTTLAEAVAARLKGAGVESDPARKPRRKSAEAV